MSVQPPAWSKGPAVARKAPTHMNFNLEKSMKSSVIRILAASLLAAAAFGAHAGKANDTLIWASNIDPPSLDYYMSSQRETTIFMNLVWDGLVARDPAKAGAYKPMLARAWSWSDPKTLEFDLRDGIKFHNGDPLTAEDVKFTLDHVRNPANRALLQDFFLWVESVEVVDRLKVRIHLKGPFLAALEYLASTTPIYPKAAFEKMGAAAFAKRPIGTGPYMVTENTPGKQIVLMRNPDYFLESPRARPAIGTLVFRPIPEITTQLAEIATGGIDWMWRYEPEQAPMLAKLPDIEVATGSSLRIGYIVMDAAKRAGASPFNDRRVRQAVIHAINREGIVKSLVAGGSQVINGVCSPMQAGCLDSKIKKYAYDQARARKLLADAGYPNGFDTDIWAYRERHYTEAVIANLRSVGIRARMQYTRYPTLRTKLHKNEGVSFAHMTFEGASVRDVSVVLDYFFTGGPEDYAQDKKLQSMLEKARFAAKPAERDKLYTEALNYIAEEAFWVPMFTYPVTYAWSKALNFKVSPDGLPRFDEARWK